MSFFVTASLLPPGQPAPTPQAFPPSLLFPSPLAFAAPPDFPLLLPSAAAALPPLPNGDVPHSLKLYRRPAAAASAGDDSTAVRWSGWGPVSGSGAALGLAGVLFLLAVLVAPEQPLDQEAICHRHNGVAACRVW